MPVHDNTVSGPELGTARSACCFAQTGLKTKRLNVRATGAGIRISHPNLKLVVVSGKNRVYNRDRLRVCRRPTTVRFLGSSVPGSGPGNASACAHRASARVLLSDIPPFPARLPLRQAFRAATADGFTAQEGFFATPAQREPFSMDPPAPSDLSLPLWIARPQGEAPGEMHQYNRGKVQVHWILHAGIRGKCTGKTSKKHRYQTV